MRNFREMIIWKQGMELAVNAYRLTTQLPREEIYGLSSQIKRAGVSIPANIAEGCSRETDKDFKKFLKTSLGSAFELETHLLIAERLQFIDTADVSNSFLLSIPNSDRSIR